MMRRWKDQHCRRQTSPLPGCLFQPCFKIHDSSFQSVMDGRWCQSCDVFSDCSPCYRGPPQGRIHGTRTLFDIRDRYHGVVLTMEVPQIQLSTVRWTFLFGNSDRYHGVSRQWRCLSFSSPTVWKTLASGGASDSVHQQRGGHSCLATETDHASHLQRTTREFFRPECVGVDRGVGSAS